VAVDGQDRQPEAEAAFEVAAGAEHRRVLDRRDDQLIALAEARERSSLDREVVGLAAARGEDDVGAIAAEQRGDLRPRLLDRVLRRRAVRVRARRVAELPLEVRAHRFEHLARDRRRGVVVEVDQRPAGLVARIVDPMAPYLAALRRVSSKAERAYVSTSSPCLMSA
jgi:hypothetical protein